MQKNIKSCTLVEQYLGYLITIKGRSNNTIIEYRTDILHFFKYVAIIRDMIQDDFKFVDLDFIKSITLADAYFGDIRTLISETSGRHIGIIRTAYRKHPDTLPG